VTYFSEIVANNSVLITIVRAYDLECVGERRLDWNVSLTGTLHLRQMYVLFTGSG